MANVIFYFSGTGNSLAVARDIADKLGDTKIVSIAEAIKAGHIDLKYDRIGFVFPTYFVSVPPIIKRFIAKLNFNRSQYIFGVITCGGFCGPALKHLDKYIKDCGGRLGAHFSIIMPGNNINLYNAWPSVIQRILIKRAKKKTVKISEIIKKKRLMRSPKGNIFFWQSKAHIDTIGNYDKFAKDYHVTEKCTGCRICERICPVDNIKMVDKKPEWADTCERCAACIQWCPTKAIEYTDKTSTRKQYRHPKVKASDLFS